MVAEYPEHERLAAISDRSQEVGAFLDWLRQDQGVHLMRWERMEDTLSCPNFNCEGGRIMSHAGRDRGPCERCNGTGQVPAARETWMADGRSPEKLLADYFGIDLFKLETEKRAMLDSIREANRA